MAKRKCTVSIFYCYIVASKCKTGGTEEDLTMPLGKKRKRIGFVGIPAWKKRKVGESSVFFFFIAMCRGGFNGGGGGVATPPPPPPPNGQSHSIKCSTTNVHRYVQALIYIAKSLVVVVVSSKRVVKPLSRLAVVQPEVLHLSECLLGYNTVLGRGN